METGVIILANGRFPENDLPVGYLNSADRIVCCDGAVEKLENYGKEPWAVVGDLDSVPQNLMEKYDDRLFYDHDQEVNDLTKAVKFCIGKGIEKLVILGATGLREDHTVGNISLLADYAESVNVKMVTDWGILIPVLSDTVISTWPGQQVSLVSPDPGARITAEGLKYPLEDRRLVSWWTGTLNEATGYKITVKPESGRVIVYLNY